MGWIARSIRATPVVAVPTMPLPGRWRPRPEARPSLAGSPWASAAVPGTIGPAKSVSAETSGRSGTVAKRHGWVVVPELGPDPGVSGSTFRVANYSGTPEADPVSVVRQGSVVEPHGRTVSDTVRLTVDWEEGAGMTPPWFQLSPMQRSMLFRIDCDGPVAASSKMEMRTISCLAQRGLVRPAIGRRAGSRWSITARARGLLAERVAAKTSDPAAPKA